MEYPSTDAPPATNESILYIKTQQPLELLLSVGASVALLLLVLVQFVVRAKIRAGVLSKIRFRADAAQRALSEVMDPVHLPLSTTQRDTTSKDPCDRVFRSAVVRTAPLSNFVQPTRHSFCQHHTRIIPSVQPCVTIMNADDEGQNQRRRDSRQECRLFLAKVRSELPEHMRWTTMRGAIHYLMSRNGFLFSAAPDAESHNETISRSGMGSPSNSKKCSGAGNRDTGSCGDGTRWQAEFFLLVYEATLHGVHRADGTCGDVTESELVNMRNYFHQNVVPALEKVKNFRPSK